MAEAIAAGFGGSKPKTTPLDFLPFPDRFKKKEEAGRKSRMSPRTHTIFKNLLNKGLIPTDVVVAFADELAD